MQEWVAEEKGYFKDEGLDYDFRETMPSTAARRINSATRSAPIRRSKQGRTCDVSGACHWTVNVAAASGHGKLYADAYSVSPAGVFVPPELFCRLAAWRRRR